MDWTQAWPFVVASAAVIFGAGQLVEKIRNGKYMRVDMCSALRQTQEERWKGIQDNITHIRKWIDSQNPKSPEPRR